MHKCLFKHPVHVTVSLIACVGQTTSGTREIWGMPIRVAQGKYGTMHVVVKDLVQKHFVFSFD